MTTEHEHQRPEGRLIADAMKDAGLSARKAADGTGITDTRLRHIINGYQPVGRGQTIEVVAPAETLARIAHRLGITAEHLRDAGRPDAAELVTDRRARTEGLGVVYDINRYQEALDVLNRWFKAIQVDEDAPTHPPVEALWLWTPSQLAAALADQASVVERAFAAETRRYFDLVRSTTGGGEKHVVREEPTNQELDAVTASSQSVDLEPEPTPTPRHGPGKPGQAQP